jgi:hypothetical protein
MMLRDDLELAVTKEKLAGLQQQYELEQQDKSGSPTLHNLTLRSLKKLINQLTEEIVRYEAHTGQRAR